MENAEIKEPKKIFFRGPTIYIMVGPSGCGKDTFIEKVIRKTTLPLSIKVISSDDIRKQLLHGRVTDKYDPLMMHVSEQAFTLLFAELEAYTTYPVNTDIVVINTTGLNDSFREKVASIALKNNYRVELLLFNYNDREEYFRYLEDTLENSPVARRVVNDHIKRMRQDTVSNLNKKLYNEIYRIKHKNFEEWSLGSELEIAPSFSEHTSSYTLDMEEYFVVGDIHGCLNTFKNLLLKKGFTIDADDTIKKEGRTRYTSIILVGDYIDKGKSSLEVIDFIYKNKDLIKIVIGNHENYVYKALKGILPEKDRKSTEFEKEYFDTLFLLQNDETRRVKFFELFERSFPFLKGRRFIVTHAPCKNKYLGRFDGKSMREMRYFSSTHSKNLSEEDYQKAVEAELSFIKEEATSNRPFHIFGHTAFLNGIRIKNKLGIDSGCVHGGKLMGVSITSDGRLFLESVDAASSEVTQPQKLISLFKKKTTYEVDADFEETFKALDYKERNRILRCTDPKINFISGTISPSDKNPETFELEGVKKALEYYKSNGVTEVTLQPKYMGSRCNIYLFKDLDKCYAVSRNGYLINRVDMTPIYKTLLEKHLGDMEQRGVKLLLLDGELLPWSVLGKGLINETFKVIEKGVESELEILEKTGFLSALESAREEYIKSGYHEKSSTTPRKDLIELYGHNKLSTYENLKRTINTDFAISPRRDLLKVYKQQLEIHAGDGEPHFKGWGVLKTVYDDGREEVLTMTNPEQFEYLNDDKSKVVSVDDLEGAQAYYKAVTVTGMEGVVVKPVLANLENVSGAMKVRNSEYLTLIYGYDYQLPEKFKKLFDKKSISRKLKTSIKEGNIGLKMLQIPYDEISKTNMGYLNAVYKMMEFEKVEKTIDPRL